MSELKEKYRKYVNKKTNYRAWYRFFYTLFGGPMKLAFPGRALGTENLPKDTGYILAFNHRSSFDIPVSLLSIPGFFHFVSKEEYYNSAFCRWLFPKFGVIAIDREKTDLSTIRKIVGILKKGEVVGIFPEGTRNRDEDADMLQFKNGTALFALQAKVPIVPVYSYRKPRMFRKNYLYIGKPVDINKYGCGPINAEKISQCANDLRDALESAKTYLCEVMEAKSYRKELRAEKRRKKTAKKLAKSAAKAAVKEQKRVERETRKKTKVKSK